MSKNAHPVPRTTRAHSYGVGPTDAVVVHAPDSVARQRAVSAEIVIPQPTLPLKETTRGPPPSRSYPVVLVSPPKLDTGKLVTVHPVDQVRSPGWTSGTRSAHVPFGSSASAANLDHDNSPDVDVDTPQRWRDLDQAHASTPHNPLCRDHSLVEMVPMERCSAPPPPPRRVKDIDSTRQEPALFTPSGTDAAGASRSGLTSAGEHTNSHATRQSREPITQNSSLTSQRPTWPSLSSVNGTPAKPSKWWENVICLSKRKYGPDPFYVSAQSQHTTSNARAREVTVSKESP